ncbi:hypothetical protein [Halomarina oriensis]|uniref:Uncharacterized protein n=1 Tax=Halomarina oriensis TaxID=671145 RepID=A0A6B0GKF1_9EURY|nr:hypothetical protein [Halomarina oriensis]MWG34361.1 hypothetical protein [Halomarina oriensis]
MVSRRQHVVQSLSLATFATLAGLFLDFFVVTLPIVGFLVIVASLPFVTERFGERTATAVAAGSVGIVGLVAVRVGFLALGFSLFGALAAFGVREATDSLVAGWLAFVLGNSLAAGYELAVAERPLVAAVFGVFVVLGVRELLSARIDSPSKPSADV